MIPLDCLKYSAWWQCGRANRSHNSGRRPSRGKRSARPRQRSPFRCKPSRQNIKETHDNDFVYSCLATKRKKSYQEILIASRNGSSISRRTAVGSVDRSDNLQRFQQSQQDTCTRDRTHSLRFTQHSSTLPFGEQNDDGIYLLQS